MNTRPRPRLRATANTYRVLTACGWCKGKGKIISRITKTKITCPHCGGEKYF